MRTSRKADFRWNKDFCSSKNNFRGHDISQRLDWEPPSLSPHFLLILSVNFIGQQQNRNFDVTESFSWREFADVIFRWTQATPGSTSAFEGYIWSGLPLLYPSRHITAIVTNCVTKTLTTCSPMIGPLFRYHDSSMK